MLSPSLSPPIYCPIGANADWIEQLSDPPAEESLEELRRVIRGGLLRALPDLNESDLDDFSQDSLLRVLERRDSFRGDSRFTTWAVAVSIRVALTALRRRKVPTVNLDTFSTLTPHGASEPPTDWSLEHRELIATLRRAIRERLTNNQRQVILALLAGVPTAAIANKLSSNRNAIYKRYHDARRRLRRALEESGYSLEIVEEHLQQRGA